MAKSKISLEDFEKLLQKQSCRKPSALYNKVLNSNEHTYKPQHVIETVYSQMRAICLADSNKNLKSKPKNLNDVKISNFLSINKLPVYHEVNKPNSKTFEHPCVSDTQLLNIIEGAEVIDTNTGMTQEFDTTFTHIDEKTNVDNDEKATQQLPTENEKQEISVFNDIENIQHSRERDIVTEKNKLEVIEEEKRNESIEINISTNIPTVAQLVTDIDSELFQTATDDTITFIQNVSNTKETVELEEETTEFKVDAKEFEEETKEIHNQSMDMDIDTGQDTQRSPSPVFNMKARKPPFPLVVSLKSFENFESIAMPLIEENIEFETAKQLINSQILGRELYLHFNTDAMFAERNNSPILELKTDELQISSQDLKTPTFKEIMNSVVLLRNTKDTIEKRSDSLKDEILFSSDEENVYIHKELQDLPLTCILETSFYEEAVVLEKTMYVGFQTASDKSIQICTNSFEKAKSILDDNDETGKEFSLKKLVEKCDTLDSKNGNTAKMAIKRNAVDSKSEFTKDDDKLIKGEDIELFPIAQAKGSPENERTNKVPPEKQSYKGFMTASYKKINMSAKALDRCQKVFKDIDLNDTFDGVEDKENAESDVERKVCLPDNNKKDDHVKDMEDDTFDDKINDELLLKEFENIEMSLEEKEISNEERGAFEGFKTANNKNIMISKEAIAKTKNIFQNIDVNADEQKSDIIFDKPTKLFKDSKIDDEEAYITNSNQPLTSETVFMGFKTANNKNIKISDAALSRSKNIFKDIDKEIPEKKCIEDYNAPSTSKAVFLGFKTTNSIYVKISNEGFSKSNNRFKDMDEEIPAQSVKEEKEPAFRGFQTASNKAVTVSANALAKTKNVFVDIDKDDEFIPSKAGNRDESRIFKGFETASKKAVVISAEALSRSKRVFQNIDNDNEIIPRKISKQLEINKDDNQIFKGFQTASNKAVTVSEDALARSKIIFQDIDNIDKGTPENTSSVGFQDFKLANSKSVEGNKEAIIASEQLVNYLDAEAKSNFVGFKTASNKNMNISEEALAKSKKLFEDIDDKPPTAAIPSTKECIFKGFQTANHKEVEVSKEALEKTKNLFQNIDRFTKSEAKVSFRGFETANNKKVTVSEEALAKSKSLFRDMDVENDIKFNNKDNIAYNELIDKDNSLTKPNFGFNTCNNKRITITEDALEKSKKLLAQKTVSNKDPSILDSTENPTKDTELKKDTAINVEGILNTQVLNDFEENMCTEDFKDTPRPNKRSGSPILSCPRAKKRKKFETPYKSDPKTVIDLKKVTDAAKEPVNAITFTRDYKKNKKYTLEDLSNTENDSNKAIDPYILNFNLENILDFEFDEARNDIKEGKTNIEELKQLFAEATDKKLIPEGWMDIHLKSILWKLISYEIKFPNTLGKVCTARNVIDQLKYRYDKELYNAERPVLRKILEKDDVPAKAMVLCVAGIYVNDVNVTSVANVNNMELLLTDGWYSLKATIDKMLAKLVYDGKIIVGSKLLTCGAELVNCEQGVAPWEDTSAVRLHISGNSTKPARWWTRLGRHPAVISCQLSHVNVDGGKAARLRARVARVYPSLYVERLPDGSTVTRSERLEHQYQMKYEAEREVMIEKIYEEVEKEFCDQDTPESEGSELSSKRICWESGSQIAQLMKRSKDPMEFRAQLTPTQVQLLQDHVSKQRDRYLQAVQDRISDTLRPRSVVTLARGRVAGLDSGGGTVAVTRGMLSVWKPSEPVLDIFKEGAWIEVTNVVPTAVRNSEIQLSAGRQSVFRRIKCKEEEILKPHLESLKRICYTIKYVSQNPSMTTDYNEIDTVGIIFSIDPQNRDFESIKNQFQNVYLADIDKNMICVNFWGGIKKFGFENVLDTGQVVYCGNLQKRAGNTRKNIPQYRATEFSVFTKTPKNQTAREMVDEINKKMLRLDRRKFCEDCMAVKLNYSVIRCFNDSENVSPYRFNNSDYNLGKHKMFIDTPIGVKVNKEKSDDLNLTGLDFESTFKQEDTQELSPKTLLRKKKVKERIAKLKMYGEPPPLSPINITNQSKNADNSFINPLLTKSDSVATSKVPSTASTNDFPNVAIKKNLPEECGATGVVPNLCSPILSMNRTYVKRSSVNPVKLNFSESAAIEENAGKSVDQFAEEFDGSPPLSLD